MQCHSRYLFPIYAQKLRTGSDLFKAYGGTTEPGGAKRQCQSEQKLDNVKTIDNVDESNECRLSSVRFSCTTWCIAMIILPTITKEVCRKRS